MSLKKACDLQLSHQILPKCVYSSVIDDSADARIIFATNTNKVVVHGTNNILNVNNEIKSIALTSPKETGTYSIIVIATTTSVIAYDFHKNVYLFQREIMDGINCIESCLEKGMINNEKRPLFNQQRRKQFLLADSRQLRLQTGLFGSSRFIIICGGNCAIWGFDLEGEDVFWSVTGDDVLSLCFCDIDGDGTNELIVGSRDSDLRIFKNEILLFELNEMDSVISLCTIKPKQFAYALANGTIGIYEGETRLWCSTDNSKCFRMILHPDNVTLICAVNIDKIHFRNIETGDIKETKSFDGVLSNIYLYNNKFFVAMQNGNVSIYETGEEKDEASMDQTDEYHELINKKNNLLVELDTYKPDDDEILESEIVTTIDTAMKSFPAGRKVETSVLSNSDISPPCIELRIAVLDGDSIRAIVLFAEGIFDGDSFIAFPRPESLSDVKIPLRTNKDISAEISIKAIIGNSKDTQMHIFECTFTLPRFSMYVLCVDDVQKCDGMVEIILNEKRARLAKWINENFIVSKEVFCDKNPRSDVKFYCIRSNDYLWIEIDGNGKVIIRNDDMGLVGNIVQAIAEYFGIVTLSSKANFPSEERLIVVFCEKVREAQLVRNRLCAEIAEKTRTIKEVLVRAEDARIIDEREMMIRYYVKLNTLNDALLSEHQIRCNNYEAMLASLRDLNKIIEKSARLRVGESASKVINGCRHAIAQEKFEILPKIIRYGT